MLTAELMVLLAVVVSPVLGAQTGSDASRGGLEYTRVAPSVREQGSANSFGSYDVFKTYRSPATLANQSRVWETAFSNQGMLGGAQNIWAAAAGFSGKPISGSLAFGGNVLISGFSVRDDLEELDYAGNRTGVRVSSGGTQVGIGGMAQYGIISLGVDLRYASFSLGGLSISDTSDLLLDADIRLTMGYFDFDVGYRDMSLQGGLMNPMVTGGMAYRLDAWWLDCVIGLQVGTVLQEGGYILGGGGFEFNVYRGFLVRTGFQGERNSGYLTAGFTIPWKEWALDYSTRYGSETRDAFDHLFGLSYKFGKERGATLLENWDRAAEVRRKKREGDKPEFGFGATGARTLAVGTFEPQGVSASDAGVIGDLFRNEMVRGRAFSVVEKANMDKVLQEQAFQQTGCTTSECAVKLGKILNVKYLIVGSFGKVLTQYVIGVRVVDVETAGIVYSDTAQFEDAKLVTANVQGLASRLTEAVQKGSK